MRDQCNAEPLTAALRMNVEFLETQQTALDEVRLAARLAVIEQVGNYARDFFVAVAIGTGKPAGPVLDHVNGKLLDLESCKQTVVRQHRSSRNCITLQRCEPPVVFFVVVFL